jgi:hypothetical protein
MFNHIDKLKPAFLAVFIVLILFILWHRIIVKNINKTEKCLDDYITSASTGMIRGTISGILLGDFGITSGLHQGAISGVLNPLMLYFEK